MSVEAVLIILASCNAGLLGLLVWHLFKCRDTRIDIATIKGSIARIEHDIGDHERGIRGQLHQQAQALTRHELDLERVRDQR